MYGRSFAVAWHFSTNDNTWLGGLTIIYSHPGYCAGKKFVQLRTMTKTGAPHHFNCWFRTCLDRGILIILLLKNLWIFRILPPKSTVPHFESQSSKNFEKVESEFLGSCFENSSTQREDMIPLTSKLTALEILVGNTSKLTGPKYFTCI